MLYLLLLLFVIALGVTVTILIFKDSAGKNPYSGRTWEEIYFERSQREDSRFQSKCTHKRWRYHNDIGYKECNECSRVEKIISK